MRSLLAINLIFSVQAFACPNLTGDYVCNGNEPFSITQEQRGSVTVYTMNGTELPANGQAMPIPDNENYKQGTYKAWCDDDITLKTQYVGKSYTESQYSGDMTVNIGLSLESTGGLKETYDVARTDGYKYSASMVCTKK